MNFSAIKPGQHYRITHLNPGEALYRQRLIAMGLLPGTSFYVSRTAPFGDPVEIEVRGFSLSLRKNEASILQVEPMEAV